MACRAEPWDGPDRPAIPASTALTRGWPGVPGPGSAPAVRGDPRATPRDTSTPVLVAVGFLPYPLQRPLPSRLFEFPARHGGCAARRCMVDAVMATASWLCHRDTNAWSDGDILRSPSVLRVSRAVRILHCGRGFHQASPAKQTKGTASGARSGDGGSELRHSIAAILHVETCGRNRRGFLRLTGRQTVEAECSSAELSPAPRRRHVRGYPVNDRALSPLWPASEDRRSKTADPGLAGTDPAGNQHIAAALVCAAEPYEEPGLGRYPLSVPGYDTSVRRSEPSRGATTADARRHRPSRWLVPRAHRGPCQDLV